jgi:micrococcal nuclease
VVNTGETKVVTKVIDGDTIIIEGGDHVRLLGIDSDEKGYPCYTPAKNRLEELILGKEVYLEPDAEDKDQYDRLLRHIFLNDENINMKMVQEGFAVARFYPENTKYKSEFVAAEKEAMENGIGCKWDGGAWNGQTEASQTRQPSAQAKENVSWLKLPGDAISACSAANYMGQEKIIEGKVASASKGGSGTVFLNFGSAYPNQCFSAVIFASDVGKFPANPQTHYKGKTVRVFGKIKEYNGKPEIILGEASQIDVGS